MRGSSPKSQANLSKGRRPPKWGEVKELRDIEIAVGAWENLKKLAHIRGVSLSEFLELIGRGHYRLERVSPPPSGDWGDKVRRSPRVTPTAWRSLKELAADHGVGVAALIEKIGQEEVKTHVRGNEPPP
jgi:predicted DNA-binding ribbon-helix-helix protein